MYGPSPIAPPMDWGSQKPPCGTAIDLEHPLSQGLVGFLPLNEMAGRLCNDATDSPKPSAGTSLIWRDNALEYDGTARRVELSWPKPLTSASMTVRFRQWTTATDMCLFGGFGGGGNIGLAMDFWSGGGAQFDLYGNGTRRALSLAASKVPVGQWHMLTCLWYGQPSTITQIWVNGRLETAGTAAGISTLTWDAQPLKLGQTSANVWSWNGSIGMAALHNRALSGDQIRLFHTQPYCMFEAGLPPAVGALPRPLVDGSLVPDTPLLGALA